MIWPDLDPVASFAKTFGSRVGHMLADVIFSGRSWFDRTRSVTEAACGEADELREIVERLRKEIDRKDQQLWEYQQIARHFVELCDARSTISYGASLRRGEERKTQ